MNRKKNNLICGWGINDVNYPISKREIVNGVSKRTWMCPYYRSWSNMIYRVIDKKSHKYHPTYADCMICDEWKVFSNFIRWVDNQPNRDWENCCLDKDFLSEDNKIYSPNTCIFIDQKLNKFIITGKKRIGGLPLGVSLVRDSKLKPFLAQCRNPITGEHENLGRYGDQFSAHKTWQAKKHEYACLLADLQEDERIAKALRERYAPDKDWTNK